MAAEDPSGRSHTSPFRATRNPRDPSRLPPMERDGFSRGWAITAGVLIVAAIIAAAAEAEFFAALLLIFAIAAVAAATGWLPFWTGGGP